MKGQAHNFVTLDVFTDRPFGGNPLAIFPKGDGIDAATMQAIAGELNLSETVFIMHPDRKKTPCVRIFTPKVELPFAGHPLVGAAIFLAEEAGMAAGTEIIMETAAGTIHADVQRQAGALARALVTAPQAPVAGPAGSAEAAAATLGIALDDLAFAPAASSAGVPYFFVPVVSRTLLSRVTLDLAHWTRSFRDAWASAIFVYTMDDWTHGGEVHGRMFGPGVGIPEDPATGSAAAALAGVLRDIQRLDAGESEWIVHQGEDMGRPSAIRIEATVSAGVVTQARIGGTAVRRIEGTIRL